jgi:hypothetical protein
LEFEITWGRMENTTSSIKDWEIESKDCISERDWLRQIYGNISYTVVETFFVHTRDSYINW